ncbi:MAG: urease accessory protein UreF [Thiohalocapsa sp.]
MTADVTSAGEEVGNPALYRLLAWLSPAFPTGAFSYSHGLEAAAAAGIVHDRGSLQAWIAALVVHGSARIDADMMRDAWRGARAEDKTALAVAYRRSAAYRATAELALESAQQGGAFLAAYEAAWAAPHPGPLPASGEGESSSGAGQTSPRPACGGREEPAPQAREGEGETGRQVWSHSAMFGAAAAQAGIALADALVGYLQAFAANIISAGLRLGIVGQTDGQRILAALEPVIAAAAAASQRRSAEDFGSAGFAADLLSMQHETQYSRLFRS